MGFQTTRSKFVDRTRHIWHFRGQRDFKCLLCGALASKPPEYSDNDWMPDKFEPLTDEERKICPQP